MTALFDAEQRSKRQLVKYNEIPPVMVQAVLAIEDRRFFEHSGVNFRADGGGGVGRRGAADGMRRADRR